MHETIDDLAAPWTLHGPELVRRMLAIADAEEAAGHPECARTIRDVIRCEHNPLADQLPPLGDPPTRTAPTLRPSTPDLVRLTDIPVFATQRRRRDPGED